MLSERLDANVFELDLHGTATVDLQRDDSGSSDARFSLATVNGLQAIQMLGDMIPLATDDVLVPPFKVNHVLGTCCAGIHQKTVAARFVIQRPSEFAGDFGLVPGDFMRITLIGTRWLRNWTPLLPTPSTRENEHRKMKSP